MNFIVISVERKWKYEMMVVMFVLSVDKQWKNKKMVV